MILQPFVCTEDSLPGFAKSCASAHEKRVFELFLHTWADGAFALAHPRPTDWIGGVEHYPPWAQQTMSNLAFAGSNGPGLPVLPYAPGLLDEEGVPFEGVADPRLRLRFSLRSSWFLHVAKSRAVMAANPEQVEATIRLAAQLAEHVEVYDRYLGSTYSATSRLLRALLHSGTVRSLLLRCRDDKGVEAKLWGDIDAARDRSSRLEVRLEIAHSVDPHTHDRFLVFQRRDGAGRRVISIGKGNGALHPTTGGQTTLCRLPPDTVDHLRRHLRESLAVTSRSFPPDAVQTATELA